MIFQLFRLLLYLTIEYPMIGIPLDILVGCGVVYYLVRRVRRKSEGSVLHLDTHEPRPRMSLANFNSFAGLIQTSQKSFSLILPTLFTERPMRRAAMAQPRWISFRPISARPPASRCFS